MFKKKTVFVIGAGASLEFGFPLGGDLKGNIAQLVNVDFESPFASPKGGDRSVALAMQDYAKNSGSVLERLVKAGQQIVEAMPGSRGPVLDFV